MTTPDLSPERLAELAEWCEDGALLHSTAKDDHAEARSARFRDLAHLCRERAEGVEGWVLMNGMNANHQDVVEFTPLHEGEPDNHDGRALLLHTDSEEG